ncbi:MAG TPA: cytochrome c [Opitutaceae bacterium]
MTPSVLRLAALALIPATLLLATATERDAALAAAAKDAAVIKAGKETYAGLCKSCHGEESVQGDSPSNLFDGKWFRAKAPAEIEAVVMQGVLDKGMPAWGEVLPPEDTLAVTAYLLSAQKPTPASAP